MKISKTLFKEYSKCNAFCGLDEIYYRKKNAAINNDELLELLNRMFDEDGEDNVRIEDEKLTVMQEYYKDVERVCLKEANKIFGKDFKYSDDTKEQMMISFYDKNGNQFYTYLDGYNDDDDIIVIEVKATTSEKYLNLGPTKKKIIDSIFELNNSIITLKDDTFYDEKKLNNYKKLFDRFSDVGKYIYDIAVTNFILEGFIHNNHRLHRKKVRLYLGLLNKKYIYDGYSDYEENTERVVHFLDVSNIVKEYQSIINDEYEKIVDNIKNLHTKDCFQKACRKDCIYCDVCFPFLAQKNSIQTLLGKKQIKVMDKTIDLVELVNNGYHKITDIPYNYLTDPNKIIQRDSVENCKEYADLKGIEKQINENIVYPIYHLDFESFQPPLPLRKGEWPYIQSVFQFSIHIQKEPFVCDKDLDNVSFIANDFKDHREELIQKMIKTIDLDNGGTVLVYNKSFEYTRIEEMITMFPKYEKPLKKIQAHMYDLMDVLKKGEKSVNYYHPDLNGSYSIKKLLPIYTNLSYSDLEVKNGIDAQVAYAKFKYLPQEDIDELRKNLIIYCKQDTYSMVEILDGLIKKSGVK